MSYTFIPTKFQWRQDTAANWAANNPIPLQGEPCLETDTGGWKLGDGVTRYSSLAYAPGSLADPGADRLLFWDASAGKYQFLALGTGLSISDTTLNASESGGGGFDPATTARFYDECYMAAITTAGWVADNSGGSIAVQQDVSGMVGAYRFYSGGDTGSRGSATAPGFKVRVGSGEIRCRFRVQPQHLPGSSQQSQYSVGLVSGLTTGSAYRIWLSALDTQPTGNWYLQYFHPSGNVLSPNPITLTPGAPVNIELVVAADGSSVAAWIDGVLRDTLALPASFDPMHPAIISRKSGVTGVSSALWVDKVLVEQDQ